MSLETREIERFGRDIPGFCWDIPAVSKSLRTKNVCVQFFDPQNLVELGSYALAKGPLFSFGGIRSPYGVIGSTYGDPFPYGPLLVV